MESHNLPALIEPLVPADCDIRGFPFMPLETQRLISSDLVAISNGDEFKAAVILWAQSWGQVPAGSLPSDERVLARLSGFSLATWREISEIALHGWIKCSDGRFYHPLIADLAHQAAARSRSQSKRVESRWARYRATKNAEKYRLYENGVPAVCENDTAGNAQPIQGRGTQTQRGKGRKKDISPTAESDGNAPHQSSNIGSTVSHEIAHGQEPYNGEFD